MVKGEGMPVFGRDSHGDLYVEYKVVLPLELTPKMRKSECPLLISLTTWIPNPVPVQNWNGPSMVTTVGARRVLGMSYRCLYFRPLINRAWIVWRFDGTNPKENVPTVDWVKRPRWTDKTPCQCRVHAAWPPSSRCHTLLRRGIRTHP